MGEQDSQCFVDWFTEMVQGFQQAVAIEMQRLGVDVLPADEMAKMMPPCMACINRLNPPETTDDRDDRPDHVPQLFSYRQEDGNNICTAYTSPNTEPVDDPEILVISYR